MTTATTNDLAARAQYVKEHMPPGGLFADQEWRISPEPFKIVPEIARELENLGRILLQFYRAVNLLYRQSLQGKQPAWIANWLDRGKPAELLDWQRSGAFKNELPRVIRPDILITDTGLSIIELDSVPGGIGLTAWLNQVYAAMQTNGEKESVIGGAEGNLKGFAEIFGDADQVHIVVSQEARTYRPEMEWLAAQLGPRFQVRDTNFRDFKDGDGIYRFFELFDVPNVPNATDIFDLASRKKVRLTAPPKPIFEEKMLFALLWNRNLSEFWRQQLGESFFRKLQKNVPYTWIVDPTPLPPQGAFPELNLTDWNQLKGLSQRSRDLILKISGFSDKAWGSRGVYLGSDLAQGEWSAAVDEAIEGVEGSPYVLQRYERPRIVESSYFDFTTKIIVSMPGRARLCPYYFVVGEGDTARTQLGGVLATICPADKKLIHGMKEAILAPCSQ